MNTELSLFERVTRAKLRFRTEQHNNLTLEDLCDLPLTKLNQAGQDIFRRISRAKSTNFLDDTRIGSPADLLMLDVVKYIIKGKQADNESKLLAKAKASKNAMIDKLIEDKEGEELKSLSKEELLKLKQE